MHPVIEFAEEFGKVVSIPVRGERCIVKNAKTGIDNFLLLFNFHYSIEALEKTRKFP